MWRVTCNQCGASTITEDGNTDRLGCPCCPAPHSHEAAANACPGAGLNHAKAPCPVGDACLVVTEAGEPCPGGHCALGVKGCAVCRPCTVSFLGMAPVLPLVIQAGG